MILQALYDYYRRLESDPEQQVAPPGFSRQRVSFRVVIRDDGTLHGIEPMSYDDKGRPTWVPQILPGQDKPTGRITAQSAPKKAGLLWNDACYLLGYVADGPSTTALMCFHAFRTKHLSVETVINDPAFSSLCRFLEQWDPSQCSLYPALSTIALGRGVYQIRGVHGYIHERPAVLAYWRTTLHDTSNNGDDDVPETGTCLITNVRGLIAKTHIPKIKGVADANSAGAPLVSFDDAAYESYGKKQSYNAPVSTDAAFRYCTALNHLLADRTRRVVIGDATTVCWTDRPAPIERAWGPMLDDRCAESPEQLKEVQELLRRIARGSAPPEALGPPQTRFFVLGLSPNAGRITVRYWFTSTIEELLTRVRQHLHDLDIVGLDPGAPPPVLRELLLETAREAKDVPPLLAGALTRSLLTGQPYPEAFFLAVLRRIRLDGDMRPRRAAILKAHLNRLHRFRPFLQEPIPMALDPNRNDCAYVLGRLFAAYEKIQRDGLREKLNRTIRDSYLSSASASPAAVFPRLYRLSQHHLNKIEFQGRRILREKLLGDLYGRIANFPSHLSHHDQGLFAIGYYHQTQAFYTGKNDDAAAPQPIQATT